MNLFNRIDEALGRDPAETSNSNVFFKGLSDDEIRDALVYALSDPYVIAALSQVEVSDPDVRPSYDALVEAAMGGGDMRPTKLHGHVSQLNNAMRGVSDTGDAPPVFISALRLLL